MTRWTLGALHSGVGIDVVDLFGVGVAVGRLVDPGLDVAVGDVNGLGNAEDVQLEILPGRRDGDGDDHKSQEQGDCCQHDDETFPP